MFLLNNGAGEHPSDRRLCSTPRVDHFSQVSDKSEGLKRIHVEVFCHAVNTPLQKRVAFENPGSVRVHACVHTTVCVVGISD